MLGSQGQIIQPTAYLRTKPRAKILLERWKQSGKTIAQFCRDENTPYHTFLYWHKKLIGTKQAKSFVKLNFFDANCSGRKNWTSYGKHQNPKFTQ
jgi:hypothetical protein